MSQNYLQFENTSLEPIKPSWNANAEDTCSISIKHSSVSSEPTVSPNKENQLICGWKPKKWSLFIGCLQIVVCTIGLATVFLVGQDKLSDSLMNYFDEADKEDFSKWTISFLIIFFSNGIFWGFLLSLGAIYENDCLLVIWLIAEYLTMIVSGLTFLFVARVYIEVISNTKIRFVPASAVLPIACFLAIGYILSVGRIGIVSLTTRQCESYSSLEDQDQDKPSSLVSCDV